MSSYPPDRRPPCPTCTGRKRSRGAKQCDACHRAGIPLPSSPAAVPVAPSPSLPAAESVSVTGDTAEVTKTTHEQVRTLADLIRVCQIDTTEWDVERYVCNKWDVGMRPAAVTEWIETKDGRQVPAFTREEGDPIVLPLFQVKAWLRRKVQIVAARAEIEAMREEAKARALTYPPIERRERTTGNLLELCLPDHHMGKLAWGAETGYEDYDVRIAERLFDDALAALLDRTASYDYDRIALVVGNDLLHADNKAGTTTKGTQVTTDSRYPKTFATTRRMLVRAIERLRTLAPVDVVIVPGNHDELSAWHLGDSLESWFHACPDVTVDNAPTQRKYCRWGRCMVMWTHGDAGKLEDYPLVMATEKPEMWGATAYREAHTGDKHQRRLIELHGVAVRILPTLCATDDWHAKHQFVGNVRCAEAYIWHQEEGLIGTAVYTVPARQPEGEAA